MGNNVCGDHWVCDPANPTVQCYMFSGKTCNEVMQYVYALIGFRALLKDSDKDADIDCATDPKERALHNVYRKPTAYFHEQIQYFANNVPIINVPFCDTCSPAYPCTLGTDRELNVTEGTNYLYQAHFNEFYDKNCKSDYYRPTDSTSDVEKCDANYDFGQLAYSTWEAATNDKKKFLDDLNKLLQSNEGLGLGWTNSELFSMAESTPDSKTIVVTLTQSPTAIPTDTPTAVPTPTPTAVPTLNPTDAPSSSPTVAPSSSPTAIPTVPPTPAPTDSPTYECAPYSNNADDLVFIGNGSNCRGGLNTSLPGGVTCLSPYLICLPAENTPAALGDQNYKSSTHRYSVEECLQECANDQRCSGIEFVADYGSAQGNCTLIDDIPVVITSGNSGFREGDARCYEKQDYCNPSFEAKDLNDAMLQCYCPNNRKGFYTKKVKRTVRNTRFCGNDTEVESRIQRAQANRMFHLCENWCLFDAVNPKGESWYYDPWKRCFREQYTYGKGHNGFCHRVISSPNAIEMQFINRRLELSLLCANQTN